MEGRCEMGCKFKDDLYSTHKHVTIMDLFRMKQRYCTDKNGVVRGCNNNCEHYIKETNNEN